MKKILASVLAVASMLSVSATAFATDKNVTKPGEVEYEVAVTAPTIVLNLVMPAKMSAALNPYGAEITVCPETAKDAGDAVTSKKGIAGAAYKITNKSKDYGVFIDATAITTVTTTDKPVDGKPAWSVTGTSVTAGTKGACLSLVALKAKPTASTAVFTASAAWTKTNAKGALAMDSKVEANKETGVVAGQTTMKKMAYVAASDTTNGDGEVYLLFAGELAGDDTANNKEVVWNDDDAINVNLVLKVNAAAKTDPTT